VQLFLVSHMTNNLCTLFYLYFCTYLLWYNLLNYYFIWNTNDSSFWSWDSRLSLFNKRSKLRLTFLKTESKT